MFEGGGQPVAGAPRIDAPVRGGLAAW
jgi:AraC family transcriptional regulator